MRSVNEYYEPQPQTEPRETDAYFCPVCGAENPETYYLDDLNRIKGCSECLTPQDAAQWEYDRGRGWLK